MFVGSVAARAVGQEANDIYLTDNWGAVQPKLRHHTVCLSPGIVLNTVQTNAMGPWQPSVAGPFSVRMVDTGTVYTPLPPLIMPVQMLVVNGVPVLLGHIITWMEELDETRTIPGARLFYHQHDARPPNSLPAPPILAQNVGKYGRFSRIHYGSQIQSYRSGF
ncbi:hypothetical protein B0H11DRAFT_1966586 [Mycena galericulata]|nr:hypothetical protein B0H11DRAFT_1966586 [Mycena galericulata]